MCSIVLLAAPAAPEPAGGGRDLPLLQDSGAPSVRPPQKPLGPRSPSAPWVEESFSRDVKLGVRSTLDLTTLRGNIAITGMDGNVIRVSATKRVAEPNKEFARTVLQNVRVQIIERGGGVDVLTEVPEGRLPPIVVDYAIGVPFDTGIAVRNTAGGSIRVSNVKGELRAEAIAGGDIILSSVGRVRIAKSVAGSVMIEGAEGDDINAEVFSGRLEVKDVRARSMELRSIGGPIIVTDVLCDRCTFNSVSGSIELSGPLKPEGRYNLNSPSGNIRIAPTGNVNFDLEAMTGGTLTNDFALKPSRGTPPSPGRRILRGIVGNGSTILSLHAPAARARAARRCRAALSA
jgi:hypothetical protein